MSGVFKAVKKVFKAVVKVVKKILPAILMIGLVALTGGAAAGALGLGGGAAGTGFFAKAMGALGIGGGGASAVAAGTVGAGTAGAVGAGAVGAGMTAAQITAAATASAGAAATGAAATGGIFSGAVGAGGSGIFGKVLAGAASGYMANKSQEDTNEFEAGETQKVRDSYLGAGDATRISSYDPISRLEEERGIKKTGLGGKSLKPEDENLEDENPEYQKYSSSREDLGIENIGEQTFQSSGLGARKEGQNIMDQSDPNIMDQSNQKPQAQLALAQNYKAPRAPLSANMKDNKALSPRFKYNVSTKQIEQIMA